MLRMLKKLDLNILIFMVSSLQDAEMVTAQQNQLFKHFILGYHQMELNMEHFGLMLNH